MNGDDKKKTTKRSSLKDDIIDLIKHEDVDELFERFLTHAKKVNKSKARANAAVLLLGLAVGIGAFYLAYKATKTETTIATKRAYDQAKAVNIQSTIRRKIDWMKRINASIINMRQVRYHIVLRCENNRPYSLSQQKLMRTNARFGVALAFTGSRFVFNDAVDNEIDKLTVFDSNVKDVCTKGAPKDAKWRAYLVKINNLMGESIKKDQHALKQLNR